MVILIAAAVLGAVVTAAVTAGDDGSADQQLEQRIASLTEERDAAEDRIATLTDARDTEQGSIATLTEERDAAQSQIATLTQERDDAVVEIEKIDAELVNVRRELQAAQNSNDDAADRVAELRSEIATLTSQRAEAIASADSLAVTIDGLETTVSGLEARAEVLDAALRTANGRVTAAVAERDALAKLFPITFDASLVDRAMPGTYRADLAQIHCSGLTSCGTVPSLDKLSISRTAEGVLMLDAPGYTNGGLSRTGGALHLVSHSTTAVPACDGVARTAEITMTLFPGAYAIGADGAASVVGVGGVLTVEAPASGACPAGLAFYGVDLTRG